MGTAPHPNVRPESPEATPSGKKPLDRLMVLLFLSSYLFAVIFLCSSGLSLI